MEFNSQICTSVEQSERLLELGLKPETADMVLIYNIFSKTYEPLPKAFPTANKCEIPAWSLHRLVCLYGQDYTIKELYNNAEECYGMLISAIEVAIENEEFNKEYLKQ